MAVSKEFIETQIQDTKKDIELANLDAMRATANFHFHRGELAAYQKIMQFYSPVDNGFVSNN